VTKEAYNAGKKASEPSQMLDFASRRERKGGKKHRGGAEGGLTTGGGGLKASPWVSENKRSRKENCGATIRAKAKVTRPTFCPGRGSKAQEKEGGGRGSGLTIPMDTGGGGVAVSGWASRLGGVSGNRKRGPLNGAGSEAGPPDTLWRGNQTRCELGPGAGGGEGQGRGWWKWAAGDGSARKGPCLVACQFG